MNSDYEDELTIDRKAKNKKHTPTEKTSSVDKQELYNEDLPKKKTKRPEDILTKTLKAEQVKEKNKEIQTFIEKMKDIVLLDNKCNSEGKPATNKLSNLNDLYSTSLDKKNQKFLLKNEILTVLKMWLEPLPDNSLPNITIRRTILELLIHFKVNTQDLKSSQIGKIVNFYYSNTNENPEIRKNAKILIQKWTKIVLDEEEKDNLE